MTDDPFASYDAAYVVGALSPHDRHAYERHLAECESCARAVRELAGMPGLLAKVPEELAVPDHGHEPLPPGLLPGLLRRVDRQRRRTRVWTFAASGLAAAACLVLALVLVLSGVVPGRGGPVAGAKPTITMTPLVDAPINATVAVEPMAWGTRVDMTCMYEQRSGAQGRVYTLVVINRAGEAERIGSWKVIPGKEAKLDGSTWWNSTAISAVEIRAEDGTTLLRVQV